MRRLFYVASLLSTLSGISCEAVYHRTPGFDKEEIRKYIDGQVLDVIYYDDFRVREFNEEDLQNAEEKRKEREEVSYSMKER